MLTHPPNLSIATFMDDDPQDTRLQLTDIGRRSHSVIQINADSQIMQGRLGNTVFIATNVYEILLIKSKFWMRDAVSKFTIIGKQQQPFGFGVQPSNWMYLR